MKREFVQIPLILQCITLEIDYIIKTQETRLVPREDEKYIVDGKSAQQRYRKVVFSRPTMHWWCFMQDNLIIARNVRKTICYIEKHL